MLLQLRQKIERILEVSSPDLNAVLVRAFKVASIAAIVYPGYRFLKLFIRRIEKTVGDGDPATVSESEQRARTLQLLSRRWVGSGPTSV